MQGTAANCEPHFGGSRPLGEERRAKVCGIRVLEVREANGEEREVREGGCRVCGER